ncbi:MAG: hypothetical protein V4644_01725 [Patescibacteria group bacterium]
MKRELKRLTQDIFFEEEIGSLEAINITREAIGLKPLDREKNLKNELKKGSRIKRAASSTSPAKKKIAVKSKLKKPAKLAKQKK